MSLIQIDTTIERIIKLFFQLGIWQSDKEPNSRKIGKRMFYTLSCASLPIFFVANAFLCADRNESILSVQIAIITAVAYVKFLYLLFKKPEILAFLYDETVVHSTENHEEYEQANKKIQKFMKFARTYCRAFAIVPFFIACKLPIFSSDRSLPFFISLSWNDSEIVYWLAYLYVSVSSILYITMNLITIVIWYIMLNYSIEYDLLGNKLRRLGVRKKTDNTDGKKKEVFILPLRNMFVENLIALIKTHRNLAETIDRFRTSLSTLFLGLITTSGITTCVSVYNLAFASNQNIVRTQFYVAILLYGILDVFLVMFLANDLTLASDRLSYCLFESNWIEQTESCKKYVLIMGEVLKQPQQLVVLIYPINLETFMKIINGAYSMFNILKNL